MANQSKREERPLTHILKRVQETEINTSRISPERAVLFYPAFYNVQAGLGVAADKQLKQNLFMCVRETLFVIIQSIAYLHRHALPFIPVKSQDAFQIIIR